MGRSIATESVFDCNERGGWGLQADGLLGKPLHRLFKIVYDQFLERGRDNCPPKNYRGRSVAPSEPIDRRPDAGVLASGDERRTVLAL
jgi:hypothetical protein